MPLRDRMTMIGLDSLFWVHTASTLMMTGLIWFVQLVHYPLVRFVGENGFTRYQHEHMRRTTWIVAPLMIAEAISAVAIFFFIQGTIAKWMAAAGCVLLLCIWISTAALQVPCHRRLIAGFNANTAERLVATNWARTIAWTLRSMIALTLPLVIAVRAA